VSTSTERAQKIKTYHQKTWPEMPKSQCRNTSNMKKQDNMTPSQPNNYEIKDLDGSEVNKISNNKLKITMVRMINEIKQVINNIMMHFKLLRKTRTN
jgi:hypothetical protein